MLMKNKAINTLEYTGVVTLSQYVGSKKIQVAQLQNEGSSSLFNFLADCLVGDFEFAKVNRPTKIMLLYRDPDNPNNYESRSGFIYQTSKPEKVTSRDTKGSVRYSFIIPKDLIGSIGSEAINCIGLYANSTRDDERHNFSAIVPVNFSTQSVSASSAVLVDWELNISNKNKES